MNLPLFYDRAGEEITIDQWSALIADLAYKRVAYTTLVDGTEISTVWLGMNHRFLGEGPPVIFETMIFGSTALAEEQWRYATEMQARDGHQHAVDLAVAEYALHHDDASVARPIAQHRD